MKRPDYWQELTEPGDIVPAGCPYREERTDGAPFHYSRRHTVEAESTFDHYRYAFDPRSRVFIDSRWKEADLAQIPDGCPMLEEHRRPQTGDAIVELVIKRASRKPHGSRRYYLDSLWEVPPKPPKRGSKLKVWQLSHLPIGSVVLDANGASWHALQGYEGQGPEWWNVSAGCEPIDRHTDAEYILLHAPKEAQ